MVLFTQRTGSLFKENSYSGIINSCFSFCLDFHCTLMMFFARVNSLFFHQCKIEDEAREDRVRFSRKGVKNGLG